MDKLLVRNDEFAYPYPIREPHYAIKEMGFKDFLERKGS